VHLAFWWDVHDHITMNLRLTPQATPINQPAFVFVTLLNRVPFGQRIGGNRDPVLWEISQAWLNLTLGADTTTAADAIKVNTKLPRSCQDRRANRKTAAFARGGENDKGVLSHMQFSVPLEDFSKKSSWPKNLGRFFRGHTMRWRGSRVQIMMNCPPASMRWNPRLRTSSSKVFRPTFRSTSATLRRTTPPFCADFARKIWCIHWSSWVMRGKSGIHPVCRLRVNSRLRAAAAPATGPASTTAL